MWIGESNCALCHLLAPLTQASHIVTNHFLHFLALDRSDPKKFQVLQLIAALLGWSEEQREQAGLARPGGPSSSSVFGSVRGLTTPMVHRTPSTPALSQDYFPDAPSPASRETLAELWQNFLEQEANSSASSTARGVKSRTASQSTVSGPLKP
jgi:GRAB domain